MLSKFAKKKISILSSDTETITLLDATLDCNQLSSECLPLSTSLESLMVDPADILIVDEKNPLNMSPIDICKFIRTKNEEVVIIILANKVDVVTKVLALELGADDCLLKPANVLEIASRIKVTLKRMHIPKRFVSELSEFEFNDIYLDAKRRVCVVGGHDLSLTNYEFLTLLQLVQNKGRSVSRVSLLADIWGLSSDEKTRPVDDIVRRLRKKLKAKQSHTQILAIWGHGYRIEAS